MNRTKTKRKNIQSTHETRRKNANAHARAKTIAKSL